MRRGGGGKPVPAGGSAGGGSIGLGGVGGVKGSSSSVAIFRSKPRCMPLISFKAASLAPIACIKRLAVSTSLS